MAVWCWTLHKLENELNLRNTLFYVKVLPACGVTDSRAAWL